MSTDNIIIKMVDVIKNSKIKEISNEVHFSGDFAEALNKETISNVERAIERAKANNRKTVYPKDL